MKTLFFTGKGGVGKSTLAAAAAWQLSQKSSVLIVSLDPAHNLGDIFGLEMRDRQIRFSPSLDLREVNLQRLSEDYLRQETEVLCSSYSYLKTLNLDHYFSTLKYTPGIEEYALLTSISKTLREDAGYDYIIFDTPPTGLTLRFLALPQVSITWIERLMHIRRQILEKRHTIHRIKGSMSSRETVLDYTEEDDDILKRLRLLNDRYQSLSGYLRGEDCHLVLVFNPETLSLKESGRLIEGLRDLGIPLRLLIDNKVSAANRDMAGQVEQAITAMTGDALLTRIHLTEALQQDGLYLIPESIVPEAWQQDPGPDSTLTRKGPG